MRAPRVVYFLITAVMAAIFLAACGGGGSNSTSGKTFTSAEQIHKAIEDGGLTSANFSSTNPADVNGYKSKPVSAGNCEVDGQEVRIVVWKDEGQADIEFGYAKTVGCALGKAFGVTEFYVARGPNWFASLRLGVGKCKGRQGTRGQGRHHQVLNSGILAVPRASPQRGCSRSTFARSPAVPMTKVESSDLVRNG